MDEEKDIWSQWLLHRRHSGDPRAIQAMLDFLLPVREKVLENAGLGEGKILLDVGAGDGLIGFGALEKFLTCQVIFSDISQDLLNHTRSLAKETGVLDRSAFLPAPAEDLSAVKDASVDAVTTRSVLIYVSNKEQAFAEFYRVLKPGGRLSIFEPINRFAFPEPGYLFCGYDVTAVMEIADKVKAEYQRLQPPDSDPMLDFDERDLLAVAKQAGFFEIHLELQAVIKPAEERAGWEGFLRIAGNPKIPNLEEAMAQTLTAEETEQFVSHLRPLVESGQGVQRSAVAFLWAVK